MGSATWGRTPCLVYAPRRIFEGMSERLVKYIFCAIKSATLQAMHLNFLNPICGRRNHAGQREQQDFLLAPRP